MRLRFNHTGASTLELARQPLNGLRIQRVVSTVAVTFSLWVAPAGSVSGAAAFQNEWLIAEGTSGAVPDSTEFADVRFDLPSGYSFYCSSDGAAVITFHVGE